MNIDAQAGEHIFNFAKRAINELNWNSFDSYCTVTFNGVSTTCYKDSNPGDIAEKLSKAMEFERYKAGYR